MMRYFAIGGVRLEFSQQFKWACSKRHWLFESYHPSDSGAAILLDHCGRQIFDAHRDDLVQSAPNVRALFLRLFRPKLSNARLAAAIARRASSSSASMARAITAPLLGLMLSMTSRPPDSTNAPSI